MMEKLRGNQGEEEAVVWEKPLPSLEGLAACKRGLVWLGAQRLSSPPGPAAGVP